ncbi:MAG: type IX secretion system membrane protein PorP/SprF [Elusimicrobia bacterium]|nr:type IX secretion system membrane protein PorP/SprF [Elusimicrobiota bacterium]
MRILTQNRRNAALSALLFAFILCPLPSTLSPVFAAFEDLGAGARGPGLGNAMAPVADDVYAAHYNPAGLGVMGRPQFTAAYTQLFSGLSDGSKLGTSFFGYAHPLEDGRRGTFAGALNSFSLDGGLYRESTLYLSYGRLAYTRPGGGELFLGTTLKYLSSSYGSFRESADATNGIISTGQADPLLQGNSSHKAFDADIGALYRFMTHYQLGLQVTHLPRPNMAFASGDSDPLPVAVKLGFNYKSLISNLVAQVETKKAPDGSADNIVTAAAERWFPKAFIGDFGVRGAMGLGTREYKQLSLGLSYRTRRVQVDYGFALPLGAIADTAGSHRMAISFHFGKPTEQEETLEMLMATMRGLKTGTVTGLPAVMVERSTVTVFAAPELSAEERAIAEKLARSEEAIKAGRYREAVSLTSAVTAAAPARAAAWQNMGIAYLGLEKYKSSLFAWEKAYEHEKSPALREAIRGYIKSITRLERSGAQRKPAAAKAPSPAQKPTLSQQEIDELLNRGVDAYVNEEFKRAREFFERVLDADPDNVEALKALRRLKDEKGI